MVSASTKGPCVCCLGSGKQVCDHPGSFISLCCCCGLQKSASCWHEGRHYSSVDGWAVNCLFFVFNLKTGNLFHWLFLSYGSRKAVSSSVVFILLHY